MRIILWMAWNEIVQLLRIRTVIIMLLGLPLMLIFLLGNALESDHKPVKLSVYANDAEQLGVTAKQYVTSSVAEAYVMPQMRDSENQVEEDLLSGKADFGFVAANGEIHYYPGKFDERNMVAESILDRYVAEIDINQSIAIVISQSNAATAIDSAASAPNAHSLVQIGNLIQGDAADFSSFSALQYYSVAYLIMFLLYAGMNGAISLTEEREKGTLLRLYAMPVSLNEMLIGKLIGIMFFAFIQAAVIVLFTKGVYGVDWGSSYGGIALICTLVSLATVCFAVILASFIRSRRAIESIFSLMITVMTFLSGGMIADLGPTIRNIGKYTINHWANEALRGMMAGGALLDNWQAVVILGAITATLLALSVVRFRKAVALT